MTKFLLLACALFVVSITVSAQAPDLIITNAKIYTADESMPYAEAIAVKADRIVSVGTNSEINQLKGAQTKVIDAGGRLVIPGINDAHDHIGHANMGKFIKFNDPLPEGPSFQQLSDSIRNAVISLPKNTWITGNIGLRILEDSNARRKQLDAIAGDNPVMLTVPWGHGTLLNTKALQLLNISPTAADPVGGFYERTANSSEITGMLHEYAGFTLRRSFNADLPDSAFAAAFRQYAANAVAMGITSVQNMATGMNPAQMLRVSRLVSLPLRMRIIRFPGTTAAGRLVAQTTITGKPSGHTRIDGIKWIIDGTPLERLAVMRNEYADKPQWYGRANFIADTLAMILKEGFKSPEQLLLHISGDSTPVTVLSSMTAIGPAAAWKNKRVRFEHADGVHAGQYPLLKQLGIVAVVNPMHFTFAPTNHQRLGKHAATYQPFRSLIEAGIPVAIGSDGPNNPWLNIMFATIHPSNPKEAVTREQALTAYTAGSAYAENMEKEKGKLKKGMLADIVILSQDILTVDTKALPATSSVLTVIGGSIVHDRLSK